MECKAFLIKYGEIGIKGKNRGAFEEALAERIRLALRHAEGEFTVRREMGRIYVEAADVCDRDEVVEALQTVFGIVGICPVRESDHREIGDMAQDVIDFLADTYHLTPSGRGSEREDHTNAQSAVKTFKVVTRRADKNFPLPSQETNALLGDKILDAFPQLKVDVHQPEILLHVEIRDRVYIYSEVLPGLGGMPVGTNGKAMLLLSGGIDSPVAGYMIAKRGVRIEAVYFHAPPYTSERARQKVTDLAEQVAKYAGQIRLHVVNFTDIQLAIYEKCPHDELTIIMRRYMMRIAERIAAQTDCQALITGESIGQVASQTVPSLVCTNEVCTMPVFRPLIAFDKQDIIDISLKIGTYETSILPYEDCCTIFVARHPVTKPKAEVIRRSEENLTGVVEEMVEKAIAEAEVVTVGE